MIKTVGVAGLVIAALAAANLGIAADPQPAAARAPEQNAVPSYSKFQYIADWNIFNVNRVGRGSNEPAMPPAQTISLVGTLDYEKGLFAIFDSSNEDDRKAAKVGEMIADYTVEKITPQEVDLVRGGKRTALGIGQQLRKRTGGGWEADATSVDSASSASPAVPADASDVLKRLMQKRQQQLKQ